MHYDCYKFNQEFTWAGNYGILEALLLLCDSWVFPFRKKMKGGVSFLSHSAAPAAWVPSPQLNFPEQGRPGAAAPVCTPGVSYSDKPGVPWNLRVLGMSSLPIYPAGGCQADPLWVCKEENKMGVLDLSNRQLFKAFIFPFIKPFGGP